MIRLLRKLQSQLAVIFSLKQAKAEPYHYQKMESMYKHIRAAFPVFVVYSRLVLAELHMKFAFMPNSLVTDLHSL